jgi:transcriptional regulator GlxA family with amidase domain
MRSTSAQRWIGVVGCVVMSLAGSRCAQSGTGPSQEASAAAGAYTLTAISGGAADRAEPSAQEDVPLLRLAREAHLSPFHFARLFRRTVGLPPQQFVLQLRIQRAIGLLKAGTISLAQIAAQCGFHDQPHFTRVLIFFPAHR